METTTLTNKWGNEITVAIGSLVGWKPSGGSEQIRRVRALGHGPCGPEAHVDLGNDDHERLGWLPLEQCWSETIFN